MVTLPSICQLFTTKLWSAEQNQPGHERVAAPLRAPAPREDILPETPGAQKHTFKPTAVNTKIHACIEPDVLNTPHLNLIACCEQTTFYGTIFLPLWDIQRSFWHHGQKEAIGIENYLSIKAI